MLASVKCDENIVLQFANCYCLYYMFCLDFLSPSDKNRHTSPLWNLIKNALTRSEKNITQIINNLLSQRKQNVVINEKAFELVKCD